MYPEVMRLAVLLSGREDVAQGITRFVISRAVPAWQTWIDDDQRRAWFFHHTLLTARRASGHKPEPGDDILLRGASTSSVPYTAFVTALRHLPFQQAEAFLLFDVLGLDLRRSATTMDLSTTATTNHLEAARKQLKQLAGAEYETFLTQARSVIFSFTTNDHVSIPAVQKAVRGYLWPRRIKRVVVIGILIVLAAVAWRFWNG